MTLDLTALGLAPVPSQENVDKAVALFNERNAALKALSGNDDSPTGKAAREEILADADLAEITTKFAEDLSAQLHKFLTENPGASVHLRNIDSFTSLKKSASDRASEDIADRVAELSSDSDNADRDAKSEALKSEARELKAYAQNLAAFGAQFNLEITVPEMDKISGPRAGNSERKPRSKGQIPALAVDGEMLAPGTSFYQAVKITRVNDEDKFSASEAQAIFSKNGQKFGKDECTLTHGGHTLTVYPLAK